MTTTDTTTTPRGPSPTGRAKAALWGGPFVLGLLLLLLGAFALIAYAATSLASILILGVMLLVSAVLEIVHAIQVRREGGFLRHFLGGVLAGVVGALLLWRPLVGVATVALLLGAFFLASGLFRGVTSVVDRYPGWGWDALYGLGAIVLGLITLAAWPRISLFLVGTLVGIEIILRGATVMSDSLSLRRTLHAPRPLRPAEA